MAAEDYLPNGDPYPDPFDHGEGDGGAGDGIYPHTQAASPEQAAELVRHLLLKALHETYILNEILPQLGERMTTFLLLVSRRFNLTLDELIADTKRVMLKGE